MTNSRGPSGARISLRETSLSETTDHLLALLRQGRMEDGCQFRPQSLLSLPDWGMANVNESSEH